MSAKIVVEECYGNGKSGLPDNNDIGALNN
jgi:hypothetical protein